MTESIETIEARITASNRAWSATQQRIKADRALDAAARRQVLEREHRAAQARHAQLVQERRAAIDAERERLTRELRAFPSRDAAGELNHRDALERAAAAKTSRDLQGFHDRAVAVGDRAGQQAALSVAVERGWFGVLVSSDDARAQRLVQFEQTYGAMQTTSADVMGRARIAGPSAPTSGLG